MSFDFKDLGELAKENPTVAALALFTLGFVSVITAMRGG